MPKVGHFVTSDFNCVLQKQKLIESIFLSYKVHADHIWLMGISVEAGLSYTEVRSM